LVQIQQTSPVEFCNPRSVLYNTLGEGLDWRKCVKSDDERVYCQIIKSLCQANIFDKNDWPSLISFFKSRMIAVDEFWSLVKYAFENLGD